MNINCIGIIPARGGSKGVRRKNIRLVSGKPLIAYSIEAAKKSRVITDFFVSTDDEEITKISASLGVEIILRPQELAEDETPMIPVIKHALEYAETLRGKKYEYIILLQPTAPARLPEDIDNATDLLINSASKSVVSVYRVEDAHPARMYRIVNNLLVPYETEPEHRLRQKMPNVYHRNGAIYACKRELLLKENKLLEETPLPYIMPKYRSINIDDELDLMCADVILRNVNLYTGEILNAV